MARSLSTKRLQIDKANATMAIIVAAAAFITIFSLVASKALLSQRNYQARVIKQKKETLAQLEANNQAADQLVTSYKAFVGSSDNIIGGTTSGSGDRDGDNAKIILDALPSKYDYPAVVTSLEKILKQGNFKINSITGTDDSLSQKEETTDTPKVVEMPFSMDITGNADTLKSLLDTFQRSIRPIHVVKMTLSGKDASLSANITAKTYYQPSKTMTITTKEIR